MGLIFLFSCLMQLGYSTWFKGEPKEVSANQQNKHTHEGHAIFEETSEFVSDAGIVKEKAAKTDLSQFRNVKVQFCMS